MTPKTNFGLTCKTNNVSKSAHIPNVFKKSLGMLKSERIPNVLKFQHIYAVKGLDLKSVPTKNKPLLRGRGNHHTYMPDNAGRVIVKSDVNLIQSPMMVVRPQAEDIKTQLAQSEKVKQIQLTSLTKVKYLQTFTQIEDSENINHLGEISLFVDSNKTINLVPYPLMDRASPQIEEKVYPQMEVGRYPPMVEKSFISWNCSSPIEGWTFTPMMEAPFTPMGKTSVHKPIANLRRCHYPNRALSKILKLVLTDYKYSNGVHSAPSGFFVRNIPMRLHIYVELWRDTFECAGNRLSLSVNPLQLRTNQMTVISEAPTSNGVHSHA